MLKIFIENVESYILVPANIGLGEAFLAKVEAFLQKDFLGSSALDPFLSMTQIILSLSFVFVLFVDELHIGQVTCILLRIVVVVAAVQLLSYFVSSYFEEKK